MWRVTLAGVVAHRLRYALTALAVLLGVAFIAGTFVLNDTINASFNGLFDQIYQGTSAVVRAAEPFDPGANLQVQRQRIPASLVGRLAKVPGVEAAAADIEGYAQLVTRKGKPIRGTSSGAPILMELRGPQGTQVGTRGDTEHHAMAQGAARKWHKRVL